MEKIIPSIKWIGEHFTFLLNENVVIALLKFVSPFKLFKNKPKCESVGFSKESKELVLDFRNLLFKFKSSKHSK